MQLTGRALVAAMCIGQLGSLLPHVTVPAIMAQSLDAAVGTERYRGRGNGKRSGAWLHARGSGAYHPD